MTSYAAAGVDIEAGDRAVELMKSKLARASRPEVVGGLGGFGDITAKLSARADTGGKLSGFEINVQQPFSFLPGWGQNFGVLANYTQVKSKMEYVLSTALNSPTAPSI